MINIKQFQNKQNSNRIEWIDAYKGISIILMVLGHTSGVLVPYVYIFHMAAFFFISGYTERLEEKSLIRVFKDKFLSLIVPYFTINIIYLLLRLLLEFFDLQKKFYSERINFGNVKSYIKLLFDINWTCDLGGASWFLIALFIGFMLAKIYTYITQNKINIITVIISFSFWLIISCIIKNKIHFKYFVDLGFNASFYIILGTYFKQRNILIKTYIKSQVVFLLISFMYFYIFSNIMNITVNYPDRKFNNIFIDFISTLIGVIIVYNLSKRFEKSKYLKYFGENSLGVLLLHFIILRFIFVIQFILNMCDENLLKSLTPYPNKISGFIYTIVIMMIFMFINMNMKYSKLYNIIVLGKLKISFVKYKLINKYKDFMNVFVSIIFLFFLINGIPIKQIYTTFNIEHNIESSINLEGRYEDGFVGKNMSGTFKSGNNGSLKIDIFNTEYTPNNEVVVNLNDKIVYRENLDNGNNTIVINIPKNEIVKVKVDFSKTFIPSQISNSKDNRELSAVISKIELN